MRFHLAQLDVPTVEPTSWRGSEAGWRAELAHIYLSHPPHVSATNLLSQPSTSLGSNALVAPDIDVDCEDFTAWEVAHAACLHLIGGTVPPERREELALLLTMP